MEVIFGTYFSGDTWDGFKFQLKNKDGSYPNIAGYTITGWFKRNPTQPAIKEIVIGTGITVLNNNGYVQIDQFDLTNWPEGKYYFQIKLTSPGGNKKTRVYGSLEVRL